MLGRLCLCAHDNNEEERHCHNGHKAKEKLIKGFVEHTLSIKLKAESWKYTSLYYSATALITNPAP